MDATPYETVHEADGGLRLSGLIATCLLHGLVVAALLFGPESCGSSGEQRPVLQPKEMQTIEAALAFKKVSRRKTRQPQKLRQVAVKPPEELVARTPVADPTPTPAPTEQEKPRPAEKFDPMAVLQRNRRLADDDQVTTEPLPEDEGSDEGSEWGTEADARGDPYVGELKGRIYDNWNVPTLERGAGAAVGCVRLNESGAIVERELVQRARNANIDRSVEEALRNTAGMDKPVPAHLRTLLLEKGVCFNFKL
jgi:hypothetical protein